MVTTMMGAGTIFMPAAVKDLGNINFVFVFSLIAFFSFLTLYMISFVANEYAKTNAKGDMSYYSITNQYSRVLAAFVDIALMIQGIGSCVLYMFSITNWCFNLLEIDSPTYMKKLLVIAGFSVLVTFIAMQKDLSALRYVQYLSVSSVFYLLGLCIYYSFVLPSEDGGKPITMDNTFKNTYSGISSFVFAIGCHQNIVQVYSELKEKSMSNITLISAMCITTGLLIYSTMGYFGYKLIGEDIGSDAILQFMFGKDNNFSRRLEALSKSTTPVKIGGVAFIVVLFCAYPMQMHPVRNGFINLISLSQSIKGRLNDGIWGWRIAITVSFCALVTLITSLTIQNPKIVETIVSFVAATAGAGTIYIIPGILFCMCRRKVVPMTILAAIVFTSGFGLSAYLIFNTVRNL